MSTYKKFTFEGSLNEEQIAFFQQYGFIHFEKFASPEAVNSIISSTEAIQTKWVEDKVEKVNGIPIKYGVDETGKTIVQRFAFTNQHSEEVNRFARSAEISSLKVLMPEDARVGLNENDGVVFNHYVNTEGSNFAHMGWHTDSARDIFYGKKVSPMLNIGLYLDDSGADQGGLRILPGTHKQNLFSLLFKKKYYMNTNADKNEVLVEAKAGDLVIHDGRIWHRVAPSPFFGAKSRRRVMYVPMVVGKFKPKTEKSSTPVYLHLLPLVGKAKFSKLKLAPVFRQVQG